MNAGEVAKQIKELKNGKAADEKGIIAEMLKHSGDGLPEVLADIFNDILKGGGGVPDDWKKTRLKVLFKKGDIRNPENYRPISILPIMLKLFSRVLLGRISHVLAKAQSADQAGFIPSFGCDDHLFALTMLHEKCHECRIPLWVAAIDFKKAFDTVEHPSLWDALQEQGVPLQYVTILRKLYDGQTGRVVANGESRPFSITRGTKQGDPISPHLFNSVLEKAMTGLKATWLKRGWGNQLGTNPEDRLSNLRFADDVLLVSRSLKVLRKMVTEMKRAVADVGLEMHFGKTKILANEQGRKQSHATNVDIDGHSVDILQPGESTKYLGREFGFTEYHVREIRHRVACGWAKFTTYKTELCDRRVSLHKRLKLFNCVVTPTVLYSSGCWTMTKEKQHDLQVAQRRMIRKIVQVPRMSSSGEEEDWVDYIRRSTRTAERCMEDNGVENWVAAQRRRKWRWAGHVARLADRRWTQLALSWTPDGSRRVGRPVTTWENDLIHFVRERTNGQSWFKYAASRENWKGLEDDYCRH